MNRPDAHHRPARLAVALLALGLLHGGPPAADRPQAVAPARASDSAASELPPVSAPPPADAGDARVVEERLLRYAHRTGLTKPEIRELARAIVREAGAHRLDPGLVLAVMHVESRYDTYAVSHKRAMGLMQIMPATGAWFAPQVGVEWHGPQTLFDPEKNVRIGVAYLRLLLDRYRGDLDAALAAYNWGPGRIDRRLARGAPLPTEYPQLVLAAYDESPRRS